MDRAHFQTPKRMQYVKWQSLCVDSRRLPSCDEYAARQTNKLFRTAIGKSTWDVSVRSRSPPP